MQEWHTQTVDAVLQQWQSDPESGLSAAEAYKRRQQFGSNELAATGGKHPLRLLWEQISSTMVLILVVAAIIAAFLGKNTEAAAIGAIVVLFVILGFVQEYRAEQAMVALKKLSVPIVRVKREGRVRELSARELVPGDLILLEAGNVIPADCRLVSAANLRLQESILTGESEPVEKSVDALPAADLPLGDRRNMVYMGTTVTYGRATAVAVATGMQTELGRIATLIQEVEVGMTPLQRQLNRVGNLLALAGSIVAALVMAIGLSLGESLEDMFLTAVSVAVAVIPEGLPAVVTVTLALGAQRMLKRRALLRKLPAVETLGSVTVICSDKTGTLTVNRMTVTLIDVAGTHMELASDAGPAGSAHPIAQNAQELFSRLPPAIGLTFVGGALCNDASPTPNAATGRYSFVGDPTEGALLVAAQQAGLTKEGLERNLPRVAELPFDSERKRMTTVHELASHHDQLPPAVWGIPGVDSPYVAFTKGAVDSLLQISDRLWVGKEPVPLDDAWRQKVEKANNELAQKGMRVLGVGLQWLDSPDAVLEQNLIFVGLVAMIDPPRPEVKKAVATCKTAGIRPMMITGDHPLTALFIADDLGIAHDGRVKTGRNLDQMDQAELERTVREVSVYARVSPEHKLRIVDALQRQGHIVGMTGDGVNDAPALRKANIGIAMGIGGTDVAKEASEMVLLDDNFATIVAAVEEGRVIYDNLRRFIKFSVAGNLGKVLVMLLAPLMGIAVALQPLQLLWLNLLTDGLMGLGLGVEEAEKGVMERPPHSPQANLFSGDMGWQILWIGALIGGAALLVTAWAFTPRQAHDETWQTMLFTTLAFLQVGQALASRSSRESFFRQSWRSNPTLFGMVLLVIVLQLLVVYLPMLDRFFHVDPLTLPELLVCITVGAAAFAAIELDKWRRGRQKSLGTNETEGGVSAV